MFYCGIDIAKYKHEASVIDINGKTLLDSIPFANDKQGCGKILAVFEKFEIAPDDVIIGMEATGHYWLSVYAFFLELGYTVKVINPIQSEAFRKMYIRQTKNDSKDSYIIAQIMRFGEYSATSLSEENIIALRQLSRYRLALVDACGDCKRRVIALLDQVFPEYDQLFTDTFGSSSTELLLNCPTPEDMLAISTRKLTNILNKASHGKFGKEKAEELKAAAKNTFGIAFAKDAFSFQIKQLMQQVVFLENQLSELEEQISNLLHETNQYITTITGIGDVLGAIIVSEIGDINRFERPNQLVAFAGLDVTVKQSGEFSGTKNKISKRGSPYLRRAIWLAAQRAAFCDPVLSEYYQSLRARGKHHLTAVGGVARKLCNIIFVILKENRPYLPTPTKNPKNLS
ncbi:IS110 family transposase [Ruminococcus sp. Marseille-P6503]|uniref:IS110 family transposase n=1 Tax=Ruminococcus sp. Marseille-P6503 TaxID=2364796 RepID=UPI000F52438F|nr:IS110 family transposase [Ruminococcus sp. Marseille-P6503]